MDYGSAARARAARQASLSGCQPSDGKDAFRRVPLVGKDAFRSVPLIGLGDFRDAVECVLTGGKVGRGGTRPYQKDGGALSHSFSVTDPLDVMHAALERPVVWIQHQALSQRILPHVSQLLL